MSVRMFRYSAPIRMAAYKFAAEKHGSIAVARLRQAWCGDTSSSKRGGGVAAKSVCGEESVAFLDVMAQSCGSVS